MEGVCSDSKVVKSDGSKVVRSVVTGVRSGAVSDTQSDAREVRRAALKMNLFSVVRSSTPSKQFACHSSLMRCGAIFRELEGFQKSAQ
jgi:hypothetical protein